jgi:MFS transporter, DHA3 family, macrolide efflux protein
MPSVSLRVLAMLWIGQAASLLGSGMTGFALGVRVYQQTGSVKSFALIQFLSLAPLALLSPLAGALTDRWDKRRTLIACDVISCTLPLALSWSLRSGETPLWQIGLGVALISTSSAFQWPAFAGLLRSIVPVEYLSRAAGATELARGLAQVLAQVLAGIALLHWSIHVLLFVDSATYLLSALLLLSLRRHIRPSSPVDRRRHPRSLLQDIVAGWRYLRGRRELLMLMAFITFTSVSLGVVEICITPLVLSFATPAELGVVLSVGGCGMLAGGVLMSIWRGARRPLRLVLLVTLVQGLLLIVGGKIVNVTSIAVIALLYLFCTPVALVSNHSIWLRVVPFAMQGSVLGLRRAVESAAMPLAALIAGPLVEHVFEPMVGRGGWPVRVLGAVDGARPGHGIVVMYASLGVVTVIAATVALWKAHHLEPEVAAMGVGSRSHDSVEGAGQHRDI